MAFETSKGPSLVGYPCADRIGFARLTTMAFGGADLRPLRDQLMSKVADGTAGAGEGLDLSLIAQLLGDKPTGMAIQAEVLAFHQLFRSPCSVEKPKLRVLALAAAMDMGGNTPIEFLLENSGIELLTLYVVAGVELPVPLPDHDVAIVIASDSDQCREALRKIDRAASRWPRPLLNPPRLVGNLDRDKLHRLLSGIEGLDIPVTAAATRAQLQELARPNAGCLRLTSNFRSSSGRLVRMPASGSPGSTIAPRLADILLGGRSRNSSSRALSTMPATTACFANTASSSSTAGPMPATWRSPIAGTSGTSTPAWLSAKASAAKRKISCAPSTGISQFAISAHWPP